MLLRKISSVILGLFLMTPLIVHAQDNRASTRGIPSDQVIVPYYLEVSAIKTVHIIFPSPVVYADILIIHSKKV